MKRLSLMVTVLAVAVLAASCKSTTALRPYDEAAKQAKQCSDTPKNAISVFLQGIKEFSLALLEATTPEGSSLYGIFGNNDTSRGKEVIRQISANPEVVEEGGSCMCSLLNMTDTSDPNVKMTTIKREVVVGEELRDYKRAFRVRFEPRGNCILQIDPIGQKWERF